MSKNKRIEELIEQHRHDLLRADVTTPVQKNGICQDGIVDENVYESNEYPRILFLLKETNGHTKGNLPQTLPDWNYRNWLEYQQANNIDIDDPMYSPKFYGAAFNKLCMWTDIFCDCIRGNVIPFEEYRAKRYNEKNFREVLKRVAIINLKKTWGGASTEWKHLYSYLNQANNEAPLNVIREEVRIIEPEIVICGGRETFDFAKGIFQGQEKGILLADGNTLSYFKAQGTLFIDFYHPSCRGAINKLYDYALKRFNAIQPLM